MNEKGLACDFSANEVDLVDISSWVRLWRGPLGLSRS